MIYEKEGGPAQPVDFYVDGTRKVYVGMSLRDWFAGQANESDIIKHMVFDTFGNCQKSREEARFAFADAMLKARER